MSSCRHLPDSIFSLLGQVLPQRRSRWPIRANIRPCSLLAGSLEGARSREDPVLRGALGLPPHRPVAMPLFPCWLAPGTTTGLFGAAVSSLRKTANQRFSILPPNCRRGTRRWYPMAPWHRRGDWASPLCGTLGIPALAQRARISQRVERSQPWRLLI